MENRTFYTGDMLSKACLPNIKDKYSFLYIDHAKIVQDEFSIAAYRDNKQYQIPLAMVNALLLGPGTSITHAAMKNIADANCTVIWVGHNIHHVYSSGLVTSEYSKNLIIQAKTFANEQKHLDVVKRMYSLRYPNTNLEKFSIQQMRGMEGKRVKELYESYADKYGVAWNGRKYEQDNWDKADDINKMLTVGNHILYSIC